LAGLTAGAPLESIMALQLGALRDALIDAGAKADKADKAAEEVAGYENRLTKLTTMVQIMIAIGLLMLASQAALWAEFGKLNGQVARIEGKLDQIAAQMK
jgi:capsule polysaccharide export protein KpsE/RkpR